MTVSRQALAILSGSVDRNGPPSAPVILDDARLTRLEIEALVANLVKALVPSLGLDSGRMHSRRAASAVAKAGPDTSGGHDDVHVADIASADKLRLVAYEFLEADREQRRAFRRSWRSEERRRESRHWPLGAWKVFTGRVRRVASVIVATGLTATATAGLTLIGASMAGKAGYVISSVEAAAPATLAIDAAAWALTAMMGCYEVGRGFVNSRRPGRMERRRSIRLERLTETGRNVSAVQEKVRDIAGPLLANADSAGARSNRDGTQAGSDRQREPIALAPGRPDLSTGSPRDRAAHLDINF